MNSTVTTVKRSLVSLISTTKGILTALTGNVTFPTPERSLATVSTALAALETAEAAVQARTCGAVAGREREAQGAGDAPRGA